MAGGIALKVDISGLTKFANQLQGAKAKMPAALAYIANTTGPMAIAAMKDALPGQTGLKSKTIDSALRGVGGGAKYTIRSKGGDIRLKYFGAHETAKGVSAAPWNSRRVYPATFIKSGWWPNRVKPIANGQVLRRVGKSKLPVTVVRSGLYIAEEMVKGASAAAFYRTVDAFVPALAEGIILGIIGGGSPMDTGGGLRDVGKRYSHVKLNDKMPF